MGTLLLPACEAVVHGRRPCASVTLGAFAGCNYMGAPTVPKMRMKECDAAVGTVKRGPDTPVAEGPVMAGAGGIRKPVTEPAVSPASSALAGRLCLPFVACASGNRKTQAPRRRRKPQATLPRDLSQVSWNPTQSPGHPRLTLRQELLLPSR